MHCSKCKLLDIRLEIVVGHSQVVVFAETKLDGTGSEVLQDFDDVLDFP